MADGAVAVTVTLDAETGARLDVADQNPNAARRAMAAIDQGVRSLAELPCRIAADDDGLRTMIIVREDRDPT